MSIVRGAAVQLTPVLYSREGTVDKVARKIQQLGRQGAAAVNTFLGAYYTTSLFVAGGSACRARSTNSAAVSWAPRR